MSRLLFVLIAVFALAGALFWFSSATRWSRGSQTAAGARPAVAASAEATPLAPAVALASATDSPAVGPPVARRAESGDAREAAASSKESELARASWVEGRVLFPAHTPADEEAFVVANGKDFADGSNHRVRIAADGSFRVAFSEKSRSGWLELEARYLYLAGAVRWKKGASVEPVVLAPVLGGRIAGRVLLPRGADPHTLAGQLELQTKTRAGPNSSRLDARSKPLPADLTFAFDALNVEASFAVSFDGPTWIGTSADLVLEAGQNHELELALRPGVRLLGRVTDEGGAPLAKVELSASSKAVGGHWTMNGHRSGRSADDGSFELGAFASGEFELEAALDGYEPIELSLGKLEEGAARAGLELVLKHGKSIDGTVRWPDGTPAEAKLALIPTPPPTAAFEWSDWDHTVEGASDANGRFHVTGLGPGPYRVQARATQKEEVTVKSPITGRERKKTKPTTWMAECAEVASGTRDLELTLSTGLVLTGLVVDDQNLALADFDVSAERVVEGNLWLKRSEDERYQAYRDASGDFVFAGFTPGEWRVSATSHGHAASDPVRVKLPGAEPVRLVLPREARIAGTVLDLDGTPVVGALVHASLARETLAGDDSPSDRSSTGGFFHIDRLAPGQVTVFAESTRAARSEPLVLELLAGEERNGLVLQLRTGATLLGQVLDADGRPEAEIEVSLYPADRNLTTDTEGRFEARGLAAGEQHLSVNLRGGVRLAQQVTLEEGETKRIVVQARATSLVRLHGRVRAGGADVDHGRIHAFSADASEGVARMELSAQFSAGSYELRLPGPGRYALMGSVSRDLGWLSWRKTVAVPAVDDFVFDVNVPLGRISGRVTDAQGQPLARVFLRTEPEQHEPGEGGSARAFTEDDGSYELTLPAGRHTVSAGGEHGFPDEGQSYAEIHRSGLVVADGEALDGVDFVLQKGGSLEGSVRGPDGRLVRNAELWSNGPSGNRSLGWAEEGSFHLDGLEPGTHWIGASQGTRTTRATLPVEIVAGATKQLELVLVQAARLHVRVTDANGALVGCDLEAVDAGGRPTQRQLGETGEAWFGPLTEGRYTVRARRDEQLLVRAVVLDGSEAERELALAFE